MFISRGGPTFYLSKNIFDFNVIYFFYEGKTFPLLNFLTIAMLLVLHSLLVINQLYYTQVLAY